MPNDTGRTLQTPANSIFVEISAEIMYIMSLTRLQRAVGSRAAKEQSDAAFAFFVLSGFHAHHCLC
jgi:hypothetical protein